MTRERFEQIRTAAHEMAAEIELAEFPHLRSCPQEARSIQEGLTKLARDERFIASVRHVLDVLFRILEGPSWGPAIYEDMPSIQEVELEAAGMVQSAFKHAMKAVWPQAEWIVRFPLLTKFRRIEHPLLQAPRGARVPSMADQMAAIGA